MYRQAQTSVEQPTTIEIILPRELRAIVYPAPQGGYMRRSTWSSWSKAICAAAAMPGQDFYNLKHRAIQWMVTPVEEGRLGLDPATVAEVVGGHDDGGYLIATVYTKLGRRGAIARAQRAMDAYQQRKDTDAEPPRLTVVRDAA